MRVHVLYYSGAFNLATVQPALESEEWFCRLGEGGVLDWFKRSICGEEYNFGEPNWFVSNLHHTYITLPCVCTNCSRGSSEELLHQPFLQENVRTNLHYSLGRKLKRVGRLPCSCERILLSLITVTFKISMKP